MSLRKIYLEQGQEAALQYAFSVAREKYPLWKPTELFIWVATLGISEGALSPLKHLTNYGSYKQINEDMLKGREYVVTFFDYSIGLTFVDVLFEPGTRTYRNPVDELERDMLRRYAEELKVTVHRSLTEPFDGVL